MKKTLLFLTLFIHIPLTTLGETGLNDFTLPPELKSIIREALETNNTLKSLRATIEGTEKKAAYDNALSDPRLGVAFANLPVGDMDFTTDPMTQKQIFIAQKFPWPGKLDLKSQGTLFEAKSLTHLHRAEQLTLARRITELYFELAYLYESLKFNDQLTELMNRIINVATTNYSSGRGLQQDIFQAEVELSKIADTNVVLKKKIRVIQNKINALLNRSEFSEIQTSGVPPLFEYNTDSVALKETVLKGNPRLAALKTAVDKNRTLTALAEKESYPDIDLKLAYGQREEDRTGRSLDDLVTLSATINIPMWKHKRQDNSVSSKKANESAAASRYNALASSLPHEAEALASEITNTIVSYKLYKERLIPQSHKWATSARSDYEVGKIEFSSMINARIQPLKFELELKQYLFDLYKKRAQLEELTGGPGFDNHIPET